MRDICPIKRIDHLEFYVGNAKQAAFYYRNAFGFVNTAYRGLETGSRDSASYLLEQGDIRFVLTTPLTSEHPAAEHIDRHGDGVAIIALEVPDVDDAFRGATARGARPAVEPATTRDDRGSLRQAAIHAYGDTLITFVDRSKYAAGFAPGFRPTGNTA